MAVLFARMRLSFIDFRCSQPALLIEGSNSGKTGTHAPDQVAVYGISGLRQSVVGESPLRPRFDEARPAQVGEMPGHRRLRQSQQGDDIAYAELASGEDVEDPNTGRIGKPSEQRVEIGDSGGRGGWHSHGRNNIWLSVYAMPPYTSVVCWTDSKHSFCYGIVTHSTAPRDGVFRPCACQQSGPSGRRGRPQVKNLWRESKPCTAHCRVACEASPSQALCCCRAPRTRRVRPR